MKEPFAELRNTVALLQLKAHRLEVVLDATTEYHVRLRLAFAEALAIAEKNASPEDLARVAELRRLVLCAG